MVSARKCEVGEGDTATESNLADVEADICDLFSPPAHSPRTVPEPPRRGNVVNSPSLLPVLFNSSFRLALLQSA